MEIPEDFIALLPKTGASSESGPIYWLWVHDPFNDEVTLEHNEDRHPAEHLDHSHLAERVPHPDRVHGFAYRIGNGWRITDNEHRPVSDPHVFRLVEKALKHLRSKKSHSQV